MCTNKIRNIFATVALVTATFAQGAVTLPHFVTDNMVIQQNAVLKLVGKSTYSNAQLTVKCQWDGKSYTTQTDDEGRFELKLNTPAAGGPYSIEVNDGDVLTLQNVMIGEVWLCSGQSNMEMPVGGWGKVLNYEQEIANANYPNLRLLQIKKQESFKAYDDTEVNMGGWVSCSPSTIENFSSIGYFFGRRLLGELKVPIGIIDCTWGGSAAECWTSLEAIKGVPGFEREVATIERNDFDYNRIKQDNQEQIEQWNKEQDALDADYDKMQVGGDMPTVAVPGYWADAPLVDFDGVVWLTYQFDLPKKLAGKPAVLHVGKIDDDDTTYLNGELVGHTRGFDAQRVYQVEKGVLKKGANVIAVKVVDYQQGGGIWGDAKDVYLEVGGEYISLAGDWSYRLGDDATKLNEKPAAVGGDYPVYPTLLYNAMLKPLSIMPVKGFLWYQGEANVGRDEQYAQLFPTMIRDWRKLWGQDVSFNFVQLAGFLREQDIQPESTWAALRAAQAVALNEPKVSMVTAIDVGNPDDIHPKNKQEVARRLAEMVLNQDYGLDFPARAPRPVSCHCNGPSMEITFDDEVVGPYELSGFVVLGADGKYYKGNTIAKDRTTLSVTPVKTVIPVEVLYDWANCPNGDVRGKNDLPVLPFKSSQLEQK